MARVPGSVARVPPLVIAEIDGAPFVDAAWLEARIYRDSARAKRWRQEAQRFTKHTDRAGIAAHEAYLWQSLAMVYRVRKWQRCLAVTQAAIVHSQIGARAVFGLLVQERRIVAGMGRPELALRAGLDRKTVFNLENARFLPSHHALQSILAVPEMHLTWEDVSPVLLQPNPADGRKHRKPRRATTEPQPKRKGRRTKRKRRFRS